VGYNQPSIPTEMNNFLSSARDFSYSGGGIVVKDGKNKENILSSLTDSGIGIYEENLENLSRIDFTRSSAGTHGEEPMGLGLIFLKNSWVIVKLRFWSKARKIRALPWRFTFRPCDSMKNITRNERFILPI
jgi:signal transduction histidine kinase